LNVFPIDEKMISITDNCENPNPDAFIFNTSLRLIEQGDVSTEAHNVIGKYLNEAENTGDNEAAIILLRQKLAILLRVADVIEKTLTEKKSIKRIIKDIQSKMKIKLKNDEIYAVRLILQGRDNMSVVENIGVSKLNNF